MDLDSILLEDPFCPVFMDGHPLHLHDHHVHDDRARVHDADGGHVQKRREYRQQFELPLFGPLFLPVCY
eukprot:c20082_g1_i2 orf=2-205(-)